MAVISLGLAMLAIGNISQKQRSSINGEKKSSESIISNIGENVDGKWVGKNSSIGEEVDGKLSSTIPLLGENIDGKWVGKNSSIGEEVDGKLSTGYV
ncbi:hypothetical protein [Francisella sp. 19X1-34]|uniref:hypothetical protein n=1 Tax=Francisella sp. 19X1-34 TaxID=3087177 RepID=UPI002E3162D7|nr:hypothetical protein [Francisella sp. 19X1-34]MED7787648.1 hypothetical protein [Francisella sp. 19X1-34]